MQTTRAQKRKHDEVSNKGKPAKADDEKNEVNSFPLNVIPRLYVLYSNRQFPNGRYHCNGILNNEIPPLPKIFFVGHNKSFVNFEYFEHLQTALFEYFERLQTLKRGLSNQISKKKTQKR